jgi:phosphatidylglycerophosphate synthase
MLSDEILVFRDGKWTDGGPSPRNTTGLADVKWYFPNLIGYARLAMCAVAAFLVYRAPPVAAALLLGATLLDWIDGPVARRVNQCSMLGSGVDWFADMASQIVAMGWWISIQPAILPWIVLATGVELCNCIFDFATTATARYPKMPPRLRDRNLFFAILDWSMPGGSYTAFGNALWLAYPLCVLAFCLQLRTASLALLFPAALYLWCELAWVVFILANWIEPARSAPLYDDAPGGFRHCGIVPEAARHLLARASASAFALLGAEFSASKARGEIFWVNIWQRSGGGPGIPVEGAENLDAWARATAARHYRGEDIELDGYGTIMNPVGSSGQEWHIDYTRGYSTIFIPMSELSPENTLQYAVLPVPATDVENPDRVDLRALVRTADWVSIRQLLAPAWSLLLMDFGTIHRGIANKGDWDRNMFWISVKKRGEVLAEEPLLQAFTPSSLSQYSDNASAPMEADVLRQGPA